MQLNKRDGFVCPACGSANEELKGGATGNSVCDRIRDMFLSLPKGNKFAAGRKFLVCKNCGHKAMLQIL